MKSEDLSYGQQAGVGRFGHHDRIRLRRIAGSDVWTGTASAIAAGGRFVLRLRAVEPLGIPAGHRRVAAQAAFKVTERLSTARVRHPGLKPTPGRWRIVPDRRAPAKGYDLAL
jgi:hypothetical protein